jgi:hypothetical protein
LIKSKGRRRREKKRLGHGIPHHHREAIARLRAHAALQAHALEAMRHELEQSPYALTRCRQLAGAVGLALRRYEYTLTRCDTVMQGNPLAPFSGAVPRIHTQSTLTVILSVGVVTGRHMHARRTAEEARPLERGDESVFAPVQRPVAAAAATPAHARLQPRSKPAQIPFHVLPLGRTFAPAFS